MELLGYFLLLLIVLALMDIAGELRKIRRAGKGEEPPSDPVTREGLAELERRFRKELGRKR